MPILNEEKHLAAAVRRITDQDYPGDVEVVLAVGPSQDRTEQVAAKLAADDKRVTVVRNESGRTPDALNAAIEHAHGDVIVRVDGHAEIPPGYLTTAVEVMRETGAVNVGGIMDARGDTIMERAIAAIMRSPVGVGRAAFHVGGDAGPAESVYLGVFDRDALIEAGGYNTHFSRAQDWELNLRLRRAGGLIWFTPAMKVTYRPRSSLGALARQYFNYGRWRRVVARHHHTVNARYLAPPVMVVLVTGATLGGLAIRPLLAIPALYLIGECLAAVWAARREGITVALAAIPALITMHWSWGLGFLTSPARLAQSVKAVDRATS